MDKIKEALVSLDFVAIDFETVSNKPGSICWAGAVKVRNGRQVDSFDCPVAPAVPRSEWNPQNMRHNHVKDEDLIGAPSWPDVLEPLREFMGEDILAFHSAKSADISMMEKACEQYLIPMPVFDYVCTYEAAKLIYPGLSGSHPYNLGNLCRKFNLGLSENEYHTATYDAGKCAELLIFLARKLNANGLVDMGEQYTIRSVIGDASLPEDVRQVIGADPYGGIDSWADRLFPEPSKPGDKCRVCGSVISNRSRKSCREYHCCTAPCVSLLEGALERAQRRLEHPVSFIQEEFSLGDTIIAGWLS